MSFATLAAFRLILATLPLLILFSFPASASATLMA
jgi:hypothetical protein